VTVVHRAVAEFLCGFGKVGGVLVAAWNWSSRLRCQSVVGAQRSGRVKWELNAGSEKLGGGEGGLHGGLRGVSRFDHGFRFFHGTQKKVTDKA